MSLYPVLPLPYNGVPSKRSASSSDDDYGLDISLHGSSSSLLGDESPSSSWAATMGGRPPLDDSSPRTASPLTPPAAAGAAADVVGHATVKDDLDSSRSSSLDLVARILSEGTADASSPPNRKNDLRNSASMPDLAEVRAMKEFDDAICAIKGEDEQPEENATKDEDKKSQDAMTLRPKNEDTEEGDRGDQEGSSFSSTTRTVTADSSQKRPKENTFRMRRSHSFACVSGLSRGVTGLSEMVRFTPAFGAIDESVPIKWKPHDPKARPRRTSLKTGSSLRSMESTASFGSSSSWNDEDRPERGSGRSSPTTTTVPKRNVSFSSLEIYEHEVTLGDNPSVTAGPPVTLEWTPHTIESHDLDEYEAARVDCRREKAQMQLPNNVRFFRLMRERGFTAMQIKTAVEEVQRVKKKRRDTVSGLKSAKLEEALESAERKMKRFLKLRKTSKIY